MLAAASLLHGCTDPGSPEEVNFGTSGAVFDDGGPAGPTTASAGDESADTTGGGPYETASCLINDDPDGLEFGYRFQCDGNFTVRAQFTYTGGSFDESLAFQFGHDLGEDPYEAPLIMACCRLPDEEGEVCDQPHFKACAIDLVEQGCRSLGPNIETEANKASGVVKEKMNKIAEWINQNQDKCVEAFYEDSGLRDSAVGCAEPSPESFLQGTQWVANHGVSSVSAVTVTLDPVELADYYPDPWFEPDDEPAQCSSDNYNNDIFFVQADPGVGDTRLVLDSGSMTLSGVVGGAPVTGDGALRGTLSGCVGDECSTLALQMQSTGIAKLTQFLGMSLAPADVGTSSTTVTLDRFRVELWEAAIGTHTSYTSVVIPPQKAQFVVSTTSENACYGVVGVNETQIQLRKIRNTYWSASTFTIVYYDSSGQPWDLVVMPSRWR